MTAQDLINFELEIKALWEAGRIKAPVHLSGGNEEQLIEIFKEVRRDDYVFSGHRNHYHALLHGISPAALMGEILGKSQISHGGSSLCAGRARSMGFIHHGCRFYASAIVGGCVNIAVGVAWALKQQLQDPLAADEPSPPPRHVWCFVGDGAVDGGHFWEALQYAEGWDLPITFVVEDNDRATCTPTKERMGPESGREWLSTKVRRYRYEPAWPHVGSGTYVQF